jgi:3-oxoacyl-(acyl-carrier-protein) synthase
MSAFIADYDVISSIGVTPEEFESGLLGGRGGVTRLTNDAFPAGSSPIGAEIKNDLLDGLGIAYQADRLLSFAEYACSRLLSHARLEEARIPSARLGVIAATSYSGRELSFACNDDFRANAGRRISPLSIIKGMANYVSSRIAARHSAEGISLTIDSACSSALHAMGMALSLIGAGMLDGVLLVCCDTPLMPQSVLGWTRLGILAADEDPARACRPFSLQRKGTVLGEGAVALLLLSEDALARRGLPPLLRVAGYGFSNDCTHMSHTRAESMEAAMAMALQNGGVPPSSVDAIAAHGTGTAVNDANELQALETLFAGHAESLPVNSIKSYCGHTIGAAGGFSVAGLIAEVKAGKVFPNLNCEDPQPTERCLLPRLAAAEARIRFAVVNSFALGGSCASCVLENALCGRS